MSLTGIPFWVIFIDIDKPKRRQENPYSMSVVGLLI